VTGVEGVEGVEGAAPFDRELAHLAPKARWRAWRLRVEAVLFASAEPVSRAALARVVGQGVSVDALIADLREALADRAFDVAPAAGGWRLHTRPALAPAIRHARGGGEEDAHRPLSPAAAVILAAIAYHQPVTRAELAEILGAEPGRKPLARLGDLGLVANGPRAPLPGAPPTLVTTDRFLARFGLQTIDDLPEPGEAWEEIG
jgi:segregation and condensation protein B